MGGNDELTAEKPRRILQEFQQLLLFIGGKAVLRFIEQVEAVFLYFFRKIQKCAFSVGMLPHIVLQAFSDKTRLGAASGQVHLLEPLIILQGLHAEILIFGVQIVFQQFFPLPVDPVVDAP